MPSFLPGSGAMQSSTKGESVQFTIANKMVAELAAGVINSSTRAMAEAAMMNESRDESSAPAESVSLQKCLPAYQRWCIIAVSNRPKPGPARSSRSAS